MTIDIRSAQAAPDDAEVVGILFRKGPSAVGETRGIDEAWLSARCFEGSVGQTQVTNVDGKTVIAVGIGDDKPSQDDLRKAAAGFARAASKVSAATLVITGIQSDDIGASNVSQAVAEGLLLALYRFTAHKSKAETPALSDVTVVGGDDEGLERGKRIAAAVILARDLINHPAGTMTPRRLAEVATEVADENGLGINVLDEDAIERERFGGLLGVAAGSSEPPRLIELTYEPASGYDRTLVLVGKGITFDSGGLSLKPADGMMTMKTDMSGAAAVIAAMSVVPHVADRTKVTAIVCATENLPGPAATKPGDVLRARNGKTMEVLNTDAEGRLVLADGLSLACEAEPDAIVDVATLTGACIVALGGEIAGLMTNHDAFGKQVAQAASDVGEAVWQLPLPERYRKHIDSDVGDIKNIGAPRGSAGALSAGLFLREFVGDYPWVHLDIAGPARSDADEFYITKGGTGFGVRTLIQLVKDFEAPA